MSSTKAVEGIWDFICLNLEISYSQADKRYYQGYISGLQMAGYLSLDEWLELEMRIMNYHEKEIQEEGSNED